MGFQFIHLETYARKADRHGRNVAWVLDEAERKEAACPHVLNPQPPEVVHGMALAAVRNAHDDAVAAHVVTLKNGRTRALRSDQKTLVTVVASHPATVDEVSGNPSIAAEVAAWEARTVAWLAGQYGDALLSVVRHTDEAHAHLHAYVLPSDLRASRLHPGAEAKRALVEAGPREGEDAKALNRRGDAAYKGAFRDWQESYWQHVGLPSGLTRLGPARRRLTRAEWHAEQVACRAAKEAADRAADIARQASSHVAAARADAAAILDAAKAASQAKIASVREHIETAKRLRVAVQQEHREARQASQAARLQARRILDAASVEARRLRSFGSRLRRVWDGLRISSIKASLRREMAAEVKRLTDRLRRAADRLGEEAGRRREAERRAADASASARALGRDRDRLRHELAALHADPSLGSAPGFAPTGRTS